MKTKLTRNIIALGVALAMLPAASLVRAAENSPDNLKDYAGTIDRMDNTEHTMKVKKFLLSKTFNLSDECVVTLAPDKEATAMALQPGMEVLVKYEEANGVSIASKVAQETHTYTGHIKTLSPESRDLTTEDLGFTRKVKLAEDCQITLHGEESKPADLKIGQRIEITYSKMGDLWWAHKVVDATESFTGTVQAVDVSADSIKVRHLLTTKKFNLGDSCKIVVNNNPDGKLTDLRIGQTVTVDFEEVKGVYVAARIELDTLADKAPEPVAVN